MILSKINKLKIFVISFIFIFGILISIFSIKIISIFLNIYSKLLQQYEIVLSLKLLLEIDLLALDDIDINKITAI
jgi:hypothetical protein